MATFSTYDAPANVTGAVGGRRASASDFGAGVGQAVQGAGAALGELGDQLRVREDKRSITQARADLSEFKTRFMRGELERQQAAPSGAPGHFEQSKSAYDEAFNEFSSGLSPLQQDAIAAEAQTARSTALRGSLSFQSGQAVKADVNNVAIILKDIGDQAYSGDLSYEDAQTQYRIALANTVIGADGQAQLMIDALPKLRDQIGNGLLENPVLGLTKLENGELDFFPEAERDKLGDLLTKRIDGMAEQANLDRLADFAVANPEVFKLVVDNQLPLRDLASVKDRLDPGVYNNLYARVAAGTIRKRSPAEVQDVTLELSAAFIALDISSKKGRKTSSEDLEDVLRFQNLVMQRVSEGGGIDGLASHLLKSTGEVAVRKAQGEHGTTAIGRFFGSDDPFELSIDAIESYAETTNITTGDKVALLLGVVKKLDEAEASGSPIEGKEAVNLVVNGLIEDRVRAANPALALSVELPNAVVKADGTTSSGVPSGAPSSVTAPDATVPAGAVLERNKTTGAFAYVVRDNNGNIKSVTEASMGVARPKQTVLQRPAAAVTPSPVSQEGTQVERNPSTGELEEVTRNAEGVAVTVKPAPEGVAVTVKPAPVPQGTTQVEQNPSTGELEEVTRNAEGVAVAVKPLSDRGVPPSQARVDVETDAVVGSVIARLPQFEGVEGDNITEVETLHGGLTRERWDEVNADAGYALSAADAQEAVVRQDFAALNSRLPGYRNLRQPVQTALLDLAYNIGTGNMTNPNRFMGLRESVAEGHETLILFNTLRTATVENTTVKGLAVRRATMFNQANQDPRLNISEVELLGDGTVNYLSGEKVVYTFKRSRHPSSKPGRVSVTGGN